MECPQFQKSEKGHAPFYKSACAFTNSACTFTIVRALLQIVRALFRTFETDGTPYGHQSRYTNHSYSTSKQRVSAGQNQPSSSTDQQRTARRWQFLDLKFQGQFNTILELEINEMLSDSMDIFLLPCKERNKTHNMKTYKPFSSCTVNCTNKHIHISIM